MAREHEMAGKDGNFDFIRKNFDRLVAQYATVIAHLGDRFADELYQEEQEAELQEISEQEMDNIIYSMNSAIVDYDMDIFDNLLKKLSKFKVSDEQRELIGKMKNAEDDFDYDELEKLVNEWSKA